MGIFKRQNTFHYSKDFMPHIIIMPVLLHPLILYHTYQCLFAMENLKFTLFSLPTTPLRHEYLISKYKGWGGGAWPMVPAAP